MMTPSSPPEFDNIYRKDEATAVAASTTEGGNAASTAATSAAATKGRGLRRLDRVKQGFAKAKVVGKDVILPKVGQVLQKINLPRLIDEMEHDQELADHLQVINNDIIEEEARKSMVREATAACQLEIEVHLNDFLSRHSTNNNTDNNDNNGPTYEEWIQELHPENVATGHIFDDFTEVDIRFYVQDSDHRLLWNSRHVDNPQLQVPARSYKHLLLQSHPDLLNTDNENNNNNNNYTQLGHSPLSPPPAPPPLPTELPPLPPPPIEPPPPPPMQDDIVMHNEDAKTSVNDLMQQPLQHDRDLMMLHHGQGRRAVAHSHPDLLNDNDDIVNRSCNNHSTLPPPPPTEPPPPPPPSQLGHPHPEDIAAAATTRTSSSSFFDVMG